MTSHISEKPNFLYFKNSNENIYTLCLFKNDIIIFLKYKADIKDFRELKKNVF